MRRRQFVVLLGNAVVGWPLGTRAQQPTMPVVGFLSLSSPEGQADVVLAFKRGLAETGYVEGRNVAIEYRWAEDHYDRLGALAAELVQRRVAVLAAPGTPAARPAKAATTDIPIVFMIPSDPVALGLVASLNHPGGNLTGVAGLGDEIASKRLELLHKAVPAAETIALLVGPSDSPYNQAETRVMQSAARGLGLRLLVFNVTTDHEIGEAFTTLAEHRASAIMVGGSVQVRAKSAQILSLAARFRLPAMFFRSLEVREGGLLSYGNDLAEIIRQIGVYTGRILKGEKPGDLPVVQPTKFDLVVNMKTAKSLGLTIPETLLATADEVIQ
jgi:putative tryptophan/tyrosine transport system substrate-binding protein